ncbi:MAG: hypothetical protein J0G96_02400 [Flavobacteriia bacterium]|uniref:hypothetical protein n=1 Tax=uncultured Flavobacterium sp. TaxID=165435 RepID=UPI0009681F61|nr:hypothetical protein [uncultured Flavobacterium sp.]MBN9292813.1 hypothetical protein [Flavobacteriia bacterium]OJX37095.1 MAG: hypothetical protein BGO87_15130 [Flavobacteriia bacterium 40-80]
MKKKSNTPILTSDLRTDLKMIMQAEIEKIPELLEQLEPKDRINVTMKMMPYLFPRVESVTLREGEPVNIMNCFP